MSSQDFNRPGAVDLSSLGQAAQQPAARSTGGGGFAFDVTPENFQSEVLNRSMSVPVVLAFVSARSEASGQLDQTLTALAAEHQGRFVLARADIDAHPELAASAQVQAVPTVVAVLRGQALPLFQGAPPESDVRSVLDQLFQAAVANGVAGRAEPIPGQASAEQSDEAAEEPVDPRFEAAYTAIEAGDYDAAAAAYQAVLAESPADADAKAGLAQVELLRRTDGIDLEAVTKAADADPADVDAQLTLADVEIAAGRVEEGFTRLIETVRRTSGDDRDRVRTRILELFEVIGSADPRVIKARAALASALF